jgi:hypothetical protein
MTLEEFRASLSGTAPPQVAPALRALWHDARGDWDAAHSVAQDVDDASGAWVHAYLHRKEGDIGNARYWYDRAGRPEATDSLDAEWSRIVVELLKPPLGGPRT